MATITIIGLGLIGGSLGLALKAAKLKDVEIVGCDKNEAVMGKARRMGAVDKTNWNPVEAVKDASLVVIATPIAAIREIMELIRDDLQAGSIVTDTGSTKVQVMRWAKEILPPEVNFVGGHPMAGKEKSDIDAAEAVLFKDKPYALIPSPDADESAVQAVEGMINAVGGKAVFLDAQEHDQFAAAISHLPLIASTALFTLARSSVAWQDLSRISGSGFRDLTRLASGDPTMSHDIAITNRDAILHWLDRFSEELNRYRDLLKEGNEGALFEHFAKAQLDRDAFINRTEKPEGPAPEIPSLNDQLATMLVGERLVQRMKEISKLLSGEAPRDDRERRRN